MRTQFSGPVPGYALVPGYQTGFYYGPIVSTTGTLALAANTLYLTPLYVSRQMLFDRLAVEVTAAGADAGVTCRIGLYRSDRYGIPALLLLDAGLILAGSADGTGTREVTIRQRLMPALYWVAVTGSGIVGAGPTLRSLTAGILPVLPISVTNNTLTCGWQCATAAGVLPASLSGLTTNSNSPRLNLRAA